MKRELAEVGLREPEFLDIDGLMRVNLWRPTADEFAARLRGEATGATDRKPIATDRDAIVTDYIRDNGAASASELALALGLGPDRTRTVLREMASRGLILKMSDKRYARYRLPGE